MEKFDFIPKFQFSSPKAGQLLIAQPMLADPNFLRAVILLCEHHKEGSFGFVLNQVTKFFLEDLFPGFPSKKLPVYLGGPVQQERLNMVHLLPEILGGIPLGNDLYCGGSFEALQEWAFSKNCQSEKVRLFIGYSGWSAGQLEQEIKEESWILADPNSNFIFDNTEAELWRESINLLGKRYSFLKNIPLNPQMN